MPVFEDSVFIACPLKDVFDFMVESENLAVWDASVKKIRPSLRASADRIR